MVGRRVSIRHSLIRNLVLLILLVSAALIATTLIAGLGAVDDLSKSRIEEAANATESELERFFGSVADYVLVGRAWAESGLLDPTDAESLNRLFVPILERQDHLSSMMVADDEGDAYLLLRDPVDEHVWTNRVVRADAWGTRARFRTWNTATGDSKESTRDVDYDPRERLWYREALETDRDRPVHWTPPVIFFTTKDPGITASTHYTPPGADAPTQVVAFDLLLLDISLFTTGLRVSENGLVFVLVEDAESGGLRVVGLPRHADYADEASLRQALLFVPPAEAVADAGAVLPPAETFDICALGAVVRAWDGQARTTESIEVDACGDAWWAGFRPFRLGDNTLWIGVAVPEQDFLADVTTRSLRIALIALIALIVAIWLALRMARGYGEPLEALARASHRIRALDLRRSEEPLSNIREVHELAHAQDQMVSALESFSRYVPIEVVKELVDRGEVAQIGGRTQELTVLFTDIAGFTSIAEGLTPRALTDHMAAYFEDMIEILRDHDATVDKFVGDAIVAFWGAPRPCEDHAERAVRAVLACRQRLRERNEAWTAEGLPPLPTRFGLSTGPVVVGNIGARSRLAYTVLGDTVNHASRLEGLNKVYGTTLLVDQSVHDACAEPFAWRRLDQAIVLGKSEPRFLYEILGRVEDVAPEAAASARRYEAAWDLFAERDFAGAIEVLDALLADGERDPATERLRDLCRDLLADPPGKDWQPATRMTRK